MANLKDLKNIIDCQLGKLDISQNAKEDLKERVKSNNNYKLFGIRFRYIAAIAVIVLICLLGVNFFNTPKLNVKANDLMKEIKSNQVKEVDLDKEFIDETTNFSVELFKNSITKDKNSLISPTSVYMALGMTGNGADKNTLSQFEFLLGNNKLSMDQLNEYYYSLSKSINNAKDSNVKLNNSIWYRSQGGLEVYKDFLQKNADYYGADAYMVDFNSKDTVKDINNWVRFNTDKRIDKIIDKIDKDTMMYLINTVLFEGKWENAYTGNQIHGGQFYTDGSSPKVEVNMNDFNKTDDKEQTSEVTVDFMNSTENSYLKDDKAEGFIKKYKGDKFSFVALLPNEGISIDDYVQSLSGNKFINILNKASSEQVQVGIPKFKYDYEKDLVEPLKKMGFTNGFDSSVANFSKMAKDSTNVCISKVLHKTFIQVDELGTKVAAATRVDMRKEAYKFEMKKCITLNRPFVYAIIDNKTKLPIFMGTVINPSK